MKASTLGCHVLGLQLNLVEAEEEDKEEREEEDSFTRPKGKWLGEALWMVLWEFALFEMQMPQRAERAGETGV